MFNCSMKQMRLVALLLLLPLLTACAGGAAGKTTGETKPVEAITYADGAYRGVYNDGGIEQFSVEFTLRENRFVSVTLNAVNYRDGNYLSGDATRIQTQVASQYEEAAAYLVGKPVSAVGDLMEQTKVTTDRDAVTAATLRTGKLISALRDGLRRGAFIPSDTDMLYLPEDLPDGIYRGAYSESARELAGVTFTLVGGRFETVEISVCGEARATKCESLLTGQPTGAMSALYGESDPVLQTMGVTSNMVVSALMDAFARGVFEPVATTRLPELGGYETGVYRGFYYEDGVERVSIQFELVHDVFGAVRFRTLVGGEGNCLAEDASEACKAEAARFQTMADYLSGKDVSRVYDLFDAERIAPETGSDSALPPNAMVAAIMDGLGRGVYRQLEMD